MISVDDNTCEWVGWLNVHGEALAVSARVSPSSKQVELESIQVDPKLLDKFLQLREKKWFVDHLTHLENIYSLPQFLEGALAGELPHSASALEVREDMLPQLLISELDSIGWEHFVSVNQALDVIKLKTADRHGFEHQFEVFIPAMYPREAPRLSVDLPVSVQLDKFGALRGEEEEEEEEYYSFSYILSTVNAEINKYEDLFTVLRDLDEHTKILESSSGNGSGVVSRRLAVSRTCSIKVTLDPLAPRAPCQVSYMGPQEEVALLRRCFTRNLVSWDPAKLVRLNLQSVLETTFIEPNTTEDLSYLNECGICYSYQLAVLGPRVPPSWQQQHVSSSGGTPSSTSSGGQHKAPSSGGDVAPTPDQICLNRKCGRLFHTACLVGWLQAVPTNKTSFGTLFGSCPYCSESISVRTFH